MNILSIVFIVSLIVYFLVSLQFQILDVFYNTAIHEFLVSDGLRGFLLNISLSVMAACAFYLFMNLIPERKRVKNAEISLRKVASVVLHAYKESKRAGHEMSAKHTPDEMNEKWILDQIKLLRKKDLGEQRKRELFLSLKFAVDAAYSQTSEMNAMISLAASISEKHALEWLNILTKLRLLAEEYDTQLCADVYDQYYDDGEHICFKEQQGKQSVSQLILATRSLRMLEYFEACRDWNQLTRKSCTEGRADKF